MLSVTNTVHLCCCRIIWHLRLSSLHCFIHTVKCCYLKEQREASHSHSQVIAAESLSDILISTLQLLVTDSVYLQMWPVHFMYIICSYLFLNSPEPHS